MLDPKKDGIDHINIYSKGKTELGRLLSNFAHTPITIKNYGKFESIEGFWYWLGTKDDTLRNLYGYEAKKYGKRLQWKEIENFNNIIICALITKTIQHKKIKDLLIKNTLPFEHYYVFNGKVVDAGFKWILTTWEKISEKLKK